MRENSNIISWMLNCNFRSSTCLFLYSIVCLSETRFHFCLNLLWSAKYHTQYPLPQCDKTDIIVATVYQSVTPLAKLTHTHGHVSFHSGSKCKQCVRGMRNKVNIALVWAIITARDDKKVSHSSCCGCSSSALVTEHNNSSVAWSTPLRSESNREGLSFLLPVYKETPVQYGKATERRFTTPSEPGALEQRGARKKGTGTEKKRSWRQEKEDFQRGVEESLWALEKFLLLCPLSQNGGERSAAWQPTTADTFTGGRPW